MREGLAVHFIGFRGEEYWSAVRIFGRPDFFHRVWDARAKMGGERASGDVLVFARGTVEDDPHPMAFNDSAVF